MTSSGVSRVAVVSVGGRSWPRAAKAVAFSKCRSATAARRRSGQTSAPETSACSATPTTISRPLLRSEEHTSERQLLMRISYADIRLITAIPQNNTEEEWERTDDTLIGDSQRLDLE